MLSQREVARSWRVGRTTIQRAIKSGKLSVSADGTLNPSELVRVFGEPKGHPKDRPAIPDDATMGRGVGQDAEALLRAENEHLKALLAEKDARIADLRQAMTLLAAPKDQASEPPRRRSFWTRLTGG